jgi:hypothetical protein
MKHEFTAISPRLFESAMAGTCQILQRDNYLGVLEPWRDYLPLEADLSNIDEITHAMRDLERCQEIVTHARVALVDSRVFDYARLVETATAGLLEASGTRQNDWKSLASHLDASEKIFVTAGAELHDAVQHLVLENPTSSLAQLDEVEAREIRELLSWYGLEKELEAVIDGHRGDSLSMRTPWIWRPVPQGVIKRA